MNSNLERIRFLNARLFEIDRMIDKGNAVAAGIQISITVGKVEDDVDADLIVDLGIPGNVSGVLEVIRDGIVKTIEWRKREAREEYEALGAFFKIEDARNV